MTGWRRPRAYTARAEGPSFPAVNRLCARSSEICLNTCNTDCPLPYILQVSGQIESEKAWVPLVNVGLLAVRDSENSLLRSYSDQRSSSP